MKCRDRNLTPYPQETWLSTTTLNCVFRESAGSLLCGEAVLIWTSEWGCGLPL